MLETQAAVVVESARVALLKSALASVAVCGVLAALTLLASDAPRPVILGFWAAIAALLSVWIGLAERRRLRQKAASLAAGLHADRVRGIRIQSPRVVEFEEIEDEGACFAFEVGPNRVVFIHGQQFYATDAFPNSDFSIIEVLDPNGAVVDELFSAKGSHLAPIRMIDRQTKARLELPGHLEVASVSLDHLEDQLPPATR